MLSGPVRVPETAGVGTAQVKIALGAWDEGQVAPSHQEVPVFAPKPGPKLLPISPRLKRELVHPNEDSLLYGLRFSPDGKQLMAGDYPGGVVVVWDVETGEELQRIETGFGWRGTTDYFFLSPDWQTLFVSREKRKAEPLEKDGKRLLRWEGDGAVLAWDLWTGELKRTYQHQPPRNIRAMQLSADGKRFITLDELPGIYEGGPKRAVSLWNVETGQYHPLSDDLQSYGIISPDGRILAITADNGDGYSQALKWIDLATGRERLSIPFRDQIVWLSASAFSPDGRLLVGNYRVYQRCRKWDTWQSSFKWWDCTTGSEVASFLEEENSFHRASFSPDGQRLVLLGWRGEKNQLSLFHVPARRLLHTISLGENPKGERLTAIGPVFSPDGRCIAVITQMMPDTPGNDEPDLRDVPQPRIHLIDVETAEIRETLNSPKSFVRSLGFSPYGRTLASGGHGKVLLWDLAT
jgi:WD40 repeat protein